MSFEVLGRLSHGDWAAHLEKEFSVRFQRQAASLKLVEVSPQKAGTHHAAAREPYSLVFLAHRSPTELSQGIYSFVASPFGDLDVFLVPIGREDGCVRLQAAFS